jgi:hypothetical protein
MQAFPHALRFLAESFVAVHESSPRAAALFATRQRWLLCHAALALHFSAADVEVPGLTRRAFGNLALRHGIASRNTAHAFFDETLKYDVIRPAGDTGNGRTDRVVPTPATLSLLVHWYVMHFRAIDLIHGGNRTEQFLASPESIVAVVQPALAEALLSSPDVRLPGPRYRIFAWADAGGLLMDRLIIGIDPDARPARDRFVTDVRAISHLAQSFGLSRAHASRIFAASESIGGIGWTGRRGRSPIWISRRLYEEYARVHARKLVILDAAFAGAAAAPASATEIPPCVGDA